MDETPKVLKDFLKMIQWNLQAHMISIRTGRGIEFLNKTLHAYYKEERIEHQTSTPITLKQNGIIERQNCTLVEAARTMLSASKLPLFFWAEAIATACYTQNRSLIIPRHEKTPYHIINDRKPTLKHLHIFGFTCYLTRDGENLDKMKEKGDSCTFMRYSTQSKGYRVYNKRTKLIVESIHINFNEIQQKAPLFEEYCTTGNQSVLKCFSLSDNSQQQDTQPTTNVQPITESITQPTTINAKENNIDQAADAPFQPYDFINPFAPTGPEVAYAMLIIQTCIHSTNTRWQLAIDPEICMFALTMSTAEPKNINEAMADSAWIEAMHDELHQFDRLQVWKLVDKPFGKTITYVFQKL
ncbi:retrovirus-related pol polyprotein from transposon TNT 1-94 [Tanacetum coccineum]|uniref:Retrovirus-related pol polyprotein from transposon TNT 1-94 n=1 Tax=Tanacetum coccineum TaxID=301880 RepID=A0ABQ5ACQ5_9ASTR